MAGWGIYILLLPFISTIMRNMFPALWQCQYKRIIGHECPLCGITRDIGTFYSTGKFGFLNNNSAICFMVLMAAVIILLLGSLLKRRAKDNDKITI